VPATANPRKGLRASDGGKVDLAMRKIHLLGLALLGVLAFSAVVAASAFAGEWLVEGAKLENAVQAETEGLLFLTTLENGNVLATVDCEGIFDGTIGPGANDLIEDVLNLAHEAIGTLEEDENTLSLSCEVTATISSLVGCNLHSLAELWVDNMSLELKTGWLSEIELMEPGGIFLDHLGIIDEANGDLTPGYHLLCLDAFGGSHPNLCTGLTSAVLTNDLTTTPASVLGEFNAESEKADCELGGVGAGDTEGSGNTWAIGAQLERLTTAVS
jgi:hypothetical protein